MNFSTQVSLEHCQKHTQSYKATTAYGNALHCAEHDRSGLRGDGSTATRQQDKTVRSKIGSNDCKSRQPRGLTLKVDPIKGCTESEGA